jgi:hypothetical protein
MYQCRKCGAITETEPEMVVHISKAHAQAVEAGEQLSYSNVGDVPKGVGIIDPTMAPVLEEAEEKASGGKTQYAVVAVVAVVAVICLGIAIYLKVI